MTISEQILEQGWASIDFPLSLEERAEYTRLGNHIIELTQHDETIRKAFNYYISNQSDTRAQQAHMFGVHGAQNSADTKLWFHVGYQTTEHINNVIPRADQPPLLKEFLRATERMLDAVELSFQKSLSAMGADELFNDLFPTDRQKRVIHIRVVRYLNARDQNTPGEPVSGHTDFSLCTLHLYETHGNWFQAVPMSQDLLLNEQSPERRAKAKAMRDNLKLIKEQDEGAIFFLGGGWKHMQHHTPPRDYETLPVCYHAGIRPKPEDEYISPYADQVLTNPNDRVSFVVFLQPSLDYVANNNYTFPSVDEIRPEY